MRPFDEIPFEESDYSDVALLMAGAREWPSEDFVRDLDARVARRFAPESAHRSSRGRLPRWAAGPAVAMVAGAVAVVVVLSSGGLNPTPQKQHLTPLGASHNASKGKAPFRAPDAGASNQERPTVLTTATSDFGTASGTPTSASGSAGASSGANTLAAPSTQQTSQSYHAASTAPIAPGAKQIRAAEISLSTPNVHVDQVAQEVFQVVGDEHGTVLSSHITTATRGSGGGYASFSLSIPTGNLQTVMTDLARLHFAALVSSNNSSQNVSHQYNSDQRQLADAQALRTSLLKQLQTAYTQSDIDSIKAQLKLAEQQISSWQNALGSLQHRISYSNLSVQINQNGLPILPVTKHHTTSGFTLSRAGHDALHVLVVSAGVALIALAVMVPLGLVVALLMWLWVWLRQRRREHALDAAS